ncbi:MAG: hypothetical protein AAGD25_12805 [Cyanobacteria bacterium P01_F01_bin.150]
MATGQIDLGWSALGRKVLLRPPNLGGGGVTTGGCWVEGGESGFDGEEADGRDVESSVFISVEDYGAKWGMTGNDKGFQEKHSMLSIRACDRLPQPYC